MSDLSKEFERASKDAQNLKKRPADEDMLRLYALYKQASAGDVSGDRPGAFDFVGRAKYDAWAQWHAMSPAERPNIAFVRLDPRS